MMRVYQKKRDAAWLSEVRRLSENGLTRKQIADVMGVTFFVIANICAKEGIASCSVRCLPVADRLRFYTRPSSDIDCDVWTGSKDKRGYGQIRINDRLRYVTHVVLEADGRPRPSVQHYACHTCDNPSCVKPQHLFWGTQKENMADCKAKGRMVPPPRSGVIVAAQLWRQKKIETCGTDHNVWPNQFFLKDGKTTCRRCKLACSREFKRKARAAKKLACEDVQAGAVTAVARTLEDVERALTSWGVPFRARVAA